MITLENYVMEQSINTTDMLDVEFEQAYAEMNVASALFDSCIKECCMMQYYQETGIVMEGEKWDKFKDKMSDAGKGLKNFVKNAWKTLLSALDKFMDSFSKVNFDKLAEKVKDTYDKDVTIEMPTLPELKLHYAISKLTEFEELTERDVTTSNVNELEKFKTDIQNELSNELYKADPDLKIDETSEGQMTISRDDLVSILRQYGVSQREIGGYRQLRRRIIGNLNKNNTITKEDGSTSKRFEADTLKSIKKLYEEIAKILTNFFVTSAKIVKTTINHVMKSFKRRQKTDKRHGIPDADVKDYAELVESEIVDDDETGDKKSRVYGVGTYNNKTSRVNDDETYDETSSGGIGSLGTSKKGVRGSIGTSKKGVRGNLTMSDRLDYDLGGPNSQKGPEFEMPFGTYKLSGQKI